MKRLILIVLIIFCIKNVSAQNDSLELCKRGFFRLHFLIPGIDYEKPLNNNITIKFSLSSGVVIGKSIGFRFTPYLNSEQRCYFSKSRLVSGCNRIDYFSNIYISLQENYIFDSRDFIFGPILGQQFQLSKKWYFDLGLGVGYDLNDKRIRLLNIGNFSIGFVID
jgi:hypothetical protein